MTSTLLNRTTATKENALTDQERDEFLTEKRVGRLATQRADGWPHVTPIWYAWEDGRFLLTLGKSRRHLRNIAGDPHVTLCVDDDPRITDPSLSPAPSCASGSPPSSRTSRPSATRRGRSWGGTWRARAGPSRGTRVVRGQDGGRDRARPLARLGPGQGVIRRTKPRT